MKWFSDLFGGCRPLQININATINVVGECQPKPPVGPSAPQVSIGKGDSVMKIRFPFALKCSPDSVSAEFESTDQGNTTVSPVNARNDAGEFVGTFDVEEGGDATYRARSTDAKGNPGTWSALQTLTNAQDTTGPNAPEVTVGGGDTAPGSSPLLAVGPGKKVK